jgi:RHS repeat-associated protein
MRRHTNTPLITYRELTMRHEMVSFLLIAISLMPGVARAQGGPEEVRYYHTDASGSVRMVTDANGAIVERYDYLPFGEPWTVSPSGAETRRFTGQERDPETGLDYFAARYYSSLNGRFVRPDDPGYMRLDDPQSWNLYTYAYNNPLRFVDPTGHDGDCIYQYDPKTGHCYVDQGTINFLLGLGRPISVAVQSTFDFMATPRNGPCLWGMTLSGATAGATAGAVGLVAPGVGEVTVAGGFVGGAAVGWAGGMTACMTSGSGNGGSSSGGGGGGGKNGWTNQTARAKAKELGFTEAKDAPFNSRNQLTFKSGNKWISPDVDGHSGFQTWKMFDRSGNRLGTYNTNLTVRLGD